MSFIERNCVYWISRHALHLKLIDVLSYKIAIMTIGTRMVCYWLWLLLVFLYVGSHDDYVNDDGNDCCTRIIKSPRNEVGAVDMLICSQFFFNFWCPFFSFTLIPSQLHT